MTTSKDSIELKVKLYDLVSKEAKKIDAFCIGIQKNVDVIFFYQNFD